jgi:nitroreductase
MRNDFEKAMNFRHACKIFDTTKSISNDDLHFVLEAGRLSPSSFGVEHWHFFVIDNPSMKEEIQKVAWNQAQITTSSKLIAIAYKKKVRSTDEYVQNEFDKFEYPQMLRDMYANWIDVRDDLALYSWSAKQVYIAGANMMTAAASIGIDSCPMEGFDKASVEKIMGLDTSIYGLALLIPFGYRVNPQPQLHRSDLKDLVSYI